MRDVREREIYIRMDAVDRLERPFKPMVLVSWIEFDDVGVDHGIFIGLRYCCGTS